MAAGAVDREFVHIVGPAGAPFGVHVERLGSQRPFGSPIKKQARSGDLASEFVCKITVRSAFLALEAEVTGATGATEVVSKTAARTPLPTHAGGQDDGSYTNSLK